MIFGNLLYRKKSYSLMQQRQNPWHSIDKKQVMFFITTFYAFNTLLIWKNIIFHISAISRSNFKNFKTNKRQLSFNSSIKQQAHFFRHDFKHSTSLFSHLRPFQLCSYNHFHACTEVSKRKMPIKQAKWTQREQQILISLVKQYGTKKWAQIARIMFQNYNTHRWSGKQCNQRWNNHLRQDLTARQWSQVQDMHLMRLRISLGNKWVQIAKSFPGRQALSYRRSVNNVKNRFYALNRRSFRRMCKFIGAVAKQINAQSIKPTTFSKIFMPNQSDQTDLFFVEEFWNKGQALQRRLSEYLLHFMDSEGKNFQTLKQKFNISQVKNAVNSIFLLNNNYQKSTGLVLNKREKQLQNEGSKGVDLIQGVMEESSLDSGICLNKSTMENCQKERNLQVKPMKTTNSLQNCCDSPQFFRQFDTLPFIMNIDDKEYNYLCSDFDVFLQN